MTRKAVAVLFLILTGLVFLPSAQAQVVTGEVTDAEQKVPFRGAIVRIQELQRSTSTDARGRFRLADVPPGNYTLVVSYVGTPDTEFPITVSETGLAMGVVVLGANAADTANIEEVLIYGQSAALAGAINQERSADNLVSVLDTDAMGQFPDQNVAESVNRLPGVSVETDQGEGRYVVIRGMDPDLNATSINGVRATSAEPRRALQLDVISSDVLDGIEVSKTLTPDMDGDSIGGSINVKTLSAFSRNGPYARARVEAQYNELREDWSPKGSVAGSNIIEMDSGQRLGIAGAISYNNRHLLVNNNEADDWEVSDNGSDFNEEYAPRLYRVDRERTGLVLNFDFDATENTSLHLYTLFSQFKDTELRDELVFGVDGLDEDSATDSFSSYYEAELEHTSKDRDQTASNSSISFGSETQLNDWLIETNLGYSFAKEKTDNGVDSVWVSEFESGDGPIVDGTPVLSFNRANPQIPVVESAYWSALQDASLYELDEIENYDEVNKDTQTSLNLDFTRGTGWGEFKFGGKGRWRKKSADEDISLYSGDDLWLLSDVEEPNGAADFGFPTPIDPIPSPSGVRDILASGEGIEFEPLDSEIESAVADFTYKEDIFAAYGMGQWENDRLLITAGVRVEWTDTDNRGNIVEIIEEGEIYQGEELEDDIAIITPVQKKTSYTDVLPSANLRFEFTEAVVARASVYKSVVRPRVEEVAFRVVIEDGEAELGNPDLDPFTAWNYDASIAYYPSELSVMSAGVFHKDIKDFIFLQTIEDYVFEGRQLDEAVIALNGESADVTGIELNYQQYFGFLPSPFDGLLAAANYTWVDSNADTGEREINLPKQSENIASFMIGYEKYGFDIRLAMKYRDSYIDELVEEDYDRITDARTQWDLTAKYTFNDSWQIYAEIANLGDEPEYYYAGRKNRLYQYDEFGTTWALGVQWFYP
ncbi:MAG TPA: TonB-dependent receptor [Xanthomonadales bacterium]|nr:TonB-dependent receptor [Xanthomonadales bacterium]